MNRIYKVIWNKARGMYVVVSELAKNHRKNAGSLSTRGGQTGSKIAIAVALALGMTMISAPLAPSVYAKAGIEGQIEGTVSSNLNNATGTNSTITGGSNNTASGERASVSGGYNNEATGKQSSVSGGNQNKATKENASVSGGSGNMATGERSSVSGGSANEASGADSSISGGGFGEASGNYSAISGGANNKATEQSASVSGGSYNKATGNTSSVSGGSENEASGTYSAISGGANNKASGGSSSVSGGTDNVASGKFSSISGGQGNKIREEGESSSAIGGYNNNVLANWATAVGGRDGVAQGKFSVVIGGGSTGTNSYAAVSMGHDSVVTVNYGVAVGYGAVTDESGTIAFGHDAGDVSGYTVDDKTGKVTGTTTFTTSRYNRLVKVADGKEDHDVATVGQLNKKADADSVYTKTEADNKFATKDDVTTDLSKKADKTAVEANTAAIAANRTDIDKNKSDIAALQNGLNAKVDADDVYSKTDADKQFATNTALAAKADQTALDAEQSARESADTSLQNQITTNTQSINDHAADLASIHQELNDIDADTLRAEGQAAKTAADNAQARADEAHQAATEAKETADKMQSSVHNTLKISDGNVLQKQTVTTSEQGEVTTAATDASTLIINKDEKNQIHFSKDEGIVVGLASTKMDAEGFTAGGHNYNAAGSALMADGRIKGANGSFKVDASGKVSAKGVDAGGEKITNVKAGTDSTDAVNVSQLSQTDQRVSHVENRISRLDNRVDKVGANAAAMANLHPMDYDADSKLNVAAAVGNYGSASAAALGVFYQPNERVMMNLSTSFGNGENMVGAGVAFKLGHIEKTQKEENVSSTDLSQILSQLQALQARQTQLEQENAALKAKVAELEKK